MKKLNDKVVSIICVVAMCITCTLSYSWKIAHKTYADTVPTTKQTLGNFLSGLMASVGIRFYIASANGVEWIVDNFNNVMETLGILVTASDIYNEASANYNQNDSTLVLDSAYWNAIESFTNWVANNYNIDSETQGVYMTDFVQTNYHTLSSGDRLNILFNHNNNNTYFINNTSNDDVRVVLFTNEARTQIWGHACSLVRGDRVWYGNTTNPTITYFDTTNNVNGHYVTYGIGLSQGTDTVTMYQDFIVSSYSSNSSESRSLAEQYAYGGLALDEVPIYGSGEASLDDLLGVETESDWTLDFTGIKEAEQVQTLTWDMILELMRESTLTGVWDEAYPVADVIAIDITINPNDVLIPDLFHDLPVIVEPECVTLGGCLVSGVQTVSQHLQDVYSSHSAISNFTAVSLAIGVAIYIITGGI